MRNYDEILKPYLDHLAAKGRKASTIRNQYNHLTAVIERLDAWGMETDPARIGEAEVRAIIKGAGIRESSLHEYILTLGRLCSYYGNDAPRRVDILWNRPTPSVHWIDAEDLRRMMGRADPPARMALVLGAMAGLRCMELANVKVGDLHRDSITVHGKGHGDGLVTDQPISPEVRAELDRYLAWRARQDPRTDRLIIWRGGTPPKDDSAHPDQVAYIRLKRLLKTVGVDFSPHALRRLYATTLHRAGVDLMTISRLMRHSSVLTTQRYIEADKSAQYEALGALARALS